MRPRLRPMGAGEIIDAGVAIYRRHFVALLTLSATVVVPAQVVLVLVAISAVPESGDLLGFADLGSRQASQDAGVVFAAGMVTLLLGFLSGLLAVATCVKLCTDAYLGGAPSGKDSLRFAAHRIGPVLVAGLVVSVLLVLGYFALVIPAVWLGVSWSVVMPVVLVEGASPARSLSRSFELVRGRWWPMFGLIVAAGLLTQFVELGLTIPLSLLFSVGDLGGSVAAQSVVGVVAAALTTPLLAATLVVAYVDLRVRKEGFDVQLLVSDLAPTTPPPAPAAPS